jgi:4-hydroxybenzoate polyprenyltransferase
VAERGPLRHFLDAIKFEHTVFALPFAYIAMILAADGWPGGRVVLWVTRWRWWARGRSR